MQETIADRMRKERKLLGWSQEDLAARIKIRQSFIGALEASNQESSKWIPEIANAFGVSAYWLKTGKGEREIASRQLTDDEETILAALPLISQDMRDSWIEAARKAIERHEPDKLRANGRQQ